MRQRLSTWAGAIITVVALLLALAALTSASAASAAGTHVPTGSPVQCQKVDPRTGLCLINLLAPGSTNAADRAGASTATTSAGRTSTTPQTCQSARSGQDVPCTSSRGIWSDARGCYIQPSADPPPAGSPLYEGHTDGAIYTCLPEANYVLAEFAYSFWAATPPAAPDPAQLAQQAIQALGLASITIGMVPRPGAGSMGLIGLPVWMWVDQPTATTFGPTSQSATAGGITVTATAHVQQITWSMGDGSTVICTGAGTPYADADGASSSPDCGHTYTAPSAGQAGEAYPVTATSRWVIDWAGGGANGEQTLDLTARTTVQIGETQALVTITR